VAGERKRKETGKGLRKVACPRREIVDVDYVVLGRRQGQPMMKYGEPMPGKEKG
jgi:hypothetical protein